jgi:hypothetical protein
MMGQSMLSYVPLNLSALDHEPRLEAWIKSWSGKGLIVLNLEGWFELGHGISGHTRNRLGMFMPNYIMGTFLWCPLSAAANVTAEELRKLRHKRE